MWRIFHSWYHSRWYRKRKEAAAKDPTWASIEARRGPGPFKLMLSDDLSWADLETQQEIEDKLYKGHTWVHRLNWWLQAHGPKTQRRKLKAFWHRGRRGWADSDTWNLCDYLARVIADSIEHLSRHTHGYPVVDGDVEGSFSAEDWEQVLAKITEGFRAVSAMEEQGDIEYVNYSPVGGYGPGSPWRARQDELQAKLDEALDLLKRWFRHLGD